MTGQFWMKVIEKERGKYPKVKLAYVPIPCMHCRDATCVKAAQDKAIYRRPDGIVIIDPVKSKGQKQLISSCPYRVIYWNEEKQIPQKCTFCAHLMDAGWKEPRCVELCPTGALVWGDLDDPNSAPSKLIASGTEMLHPEYGLKERVSYVNLPKKFVAGTVIYGDKDECAEGVTVTLSRNGEKKTTKTNFFGDFEFDGLPDNADYTVQIRAPGYKGQELEAKTKVDVYLGNIILEKTKK
jgi:Fe-S-cluster-containing dehydrogenase component